MKKENLQFYRPKGSKIVDRNNNVIDYADYMKKGIGIDTGALGGVQIGQIYPEYYSNFSYGIDYTKLTTLTQGGATVTVEESLVCLNTSLVESVASIKTKEVIRCKAGSNAEVRFAYKFSQPQSMLDDLVGISNDENAFMIGFVDGEFGILERFKEYDIFTPNNEFNIDNLDGSGVSGKTIDLTKLNAYRVSWGFLEVAPIVLEAMIDGSWVPFHTVILDNRFDSSGITYQYYNFSAYTMNYGASEVATGCLGSFYMGYVGYRLHPSEDVSSRQFSRDISVPAITNGVNNRVIVFRNKLLYNGKQNMISALLIFLSGSAKANKPINLKMSKLAIAPTGGTWSNVSTNSIMEVSTDTTINMTGSDLLVPFSIPESGVFFEDVSKYNLNLYPGESAVITYTTTGNSGELYVANRWFELF